MGAYGSMEPYLMVQFPKKPRRRKLWGVELYGCWGLFHFFSVCRKSGPGLVVKQKERHEGLLLHTFISNSTHSSYTITEF